MTRRVSYVWKPSLNTQWYATGMVSANAVRPDQRCAGLIQRGLGHGSSR
jgi:hypothetical protein